MPDNHKQSPSPTEAEASISTNMHSHAAGVSSRTFAACSILIARHHRNLAISLACGVALLLSARLGHAMDGTPTPAAEALKTFDSLNHPKANGIHLSIDLPASWISEEGKRPHILQKFMPSDRGVIGMIFVKTLPPPGADTWASPASEAFMRQFVSELGGAYLRGGSTKLEGLDAGWAIHREDAERVGVKLSSVSLSYILFYKNCWLQFEFIVSGRSGDTLLEQRFEAYYPQLIRILNSVVIHDNWK